MKKRYQKGGTVRTTRTVVQRGKINPKTGRRGPDAVQDVRNPTKKQVRKGKRPVSVSSTKYQKGGKKVKSSLKYTPGFPATRDKPSPYDLKTLQKAISRDSTTVADRGWLGDFLDPETGPSPKRKLQINREYRDKVTGADSEKTAKKINIMKNKKQRGGRLSPEAIWDKVSTGAAGKKPKTSKELKAEAKALRKKAKALAKTERRTKMEAELDKTEGWLQTGGEVEFGKPKKKQDGGAAADSAAVRRADWEKKGATADSGRGTHKSQKIGYSDAYAEDSFVRDSIAEAKVGNIGIKREDHRMSRTGKEEIDDIKKGTAARRRLAKQDEEANQALADRKAENARQDSDRDFARSKKRHSGSYQRGGVPHRRTKEKLYDLEQKGDSMAILTNKWMRNPASLTKKDQAFIKQYEREHKKQKGEGNNKKQLGGLLGGAVKGAMGSIGSGKGLKGILGGAAKGAIGSIPGVGGALAQAIPGGAAPAAPAAAVQQPAANPAAAQAVQDPNAVVAKKGGLKDRRKSYQRGGSQSGKAARARRKSGKSKKKAMSNLGGGRKGNRGMRG